MQFQFNPADIQATGVGITAFLATVLLIFVFLSARHERLGRPMWIMLATATVWSWFGFLYHIVPNLSLARDMRVISVMGIVWISMSVMNFATVYLSVRVPIRRLTNAVRLLVFAGGTILTGLLFADLFGTQYVVGGLLLPQSTALAPQAGPLMIVLIGYFIVCTALSGLLLAWRARAGVDESERRQALILFVSMTVGLALGATRFTPWYGFDFYPLVGDIGFPMFVFAAFYSMKEYHLLNVQVAAAQLFIFTLWTLSFFRILVHTNVHEAVPDIAFFSAVFVLGVFLLRSMIMQASAQREMSMMMADRTKAEFIAVAAHQLRTPIAGMRWIFGLLEGDAALSRDQHDLVVKGSLAADAMMRIINGLLNVAQISSGRFSFTFAIHDLYEVLAGAIAALEGRVTTKRLKLTFDPAEHVLTSIDADKLLLALENLVDNAVKYTPEDGTVHVSLESTETGARIVVTDSGIGMSKEDQERLFERFYRSKHAVQMFRDGSGLGLFIAKTIIDGHGGTISVTSEEGSGMTVTVTLPKEAPVSV